MSTYRFVEHVGELELDIEATTEAGIFAEALAAFAELLASDGGALVQREIDLPRADSALLLVDWLGELVFLAEVEQFVPERIVSLELADGLRATVEGHYGRPRHLVKAVTLNDLKLAREGAGWNARVVLDV